MIEVVHGVRAVIEDASGARAVIEDVGEMDEAVKLQLEAANQRNEAQKKVEVAGIGVSAEVEAKIKPHKLLQGQGQSLSQDPVVKMRSEISLMIALEQSIKTITSSFNTKNLAQMLLCVVGSLLSIKFQK